MMALLNLKVVLKISIVVNAKVSHRLIVKIKKKLDCFLFWTITCNWEHLRPTYYAISTRACPQFFPIWGISGNFKIFSSPFLEEFWLGNWGKMVKIKTPISRIDCQKTGFFSSIGRVFNQIAINIRFLLVLIPFSSISPGEFRSRNHAILRSKGNYF